MCRGGSAGQFLRQSPRDTIQDSHLLRFQTWILTIAVPLSLPAQRVDFARQVRPILSDRCFLCHGPDESTRKANLRLDTEDGAKSARGAKTPILPGKPAESEVMRRITSTNPALRMPPSYAGHKPLAAGESDILRRWILQGAEWQSHWAFVPPRRPELPAVRNQAWPRNAIDRFVLARLEKEGLSPSPELDRASLLRRVSLDLTGLPPTLSELDAFLSDRSPNAYEKVVDRLLASPRYGERMAIDWLDAARYADTHGYQVDPEKEMWAWRDWVIQAFNRNQPFDQFTVEQIAGDLLPQATLEQKIATGFNRNHRVNTEAGSIAEEFHVENVVDRISTIGTVWLGLTVGCARCHDHKYDPIRMRDFYSIFAFFNNVKEVGTGGPRDGRGNLQPVMKLPAPELEARLAAADQEVKQARRELLDLEETLVARQPNWEKRFSSYQPLWEVVPPLEVRSANGVTLTPQPDLSVLASGKHPDRDIYTVTFETRLPRITALRLELLPDPSLPKGGSGRDPDGKGVVTFFEARIAPVGKPSEERKLELDKASADFASPESILERVIRPMLQVRRGWSVDPQVDRPHYVVIEPRTVAGFPEGSRLTVRIGNEFGDGALLGRFRLSVTEAEFPEPVPDAIRTALAKPAAERTQEEADALRKFHVSHLQERRKLADRLVALEAARRAAENSIPSTMVMVEMPSPRDTFLLERGSYEKPGEKVGAAVPAFLPPLPQGAAADRLGFAKWLVDPAHPLTARVAVNRFWQGYFGTGLVKTADDFGSQGEPPSHPELLDWLATEFISSGWNGKAMQKLIVMSATYRQSSKAVAALIEKDPENRLLARGPRFRMPAEMIRDQALLVAGLLHEKQGGPPVKPYQPDGIWEQLSVIDDRKLYERSKAPDLWRRSLYTYWKRTAPPPGLTTFDAPTREFCVVRRSRSSTPLQALVLLNDETYIEAARMLAERMIKQGGMQASSRIAFGFRLATLRSPATAETQVLQAGLEHRLKLYRNDAKAAAALLRNGEAPRDMTIDPVELAAYTTVASVILNLDEVVTKQ